MSNALSIAARFLKFGPHAIWFGMNTVIIMALSYQSGWLIAFYYLTIYLAMGSLVIWHFGYRFFPLYLEKEAKMDAQLRKQLVISLLLFVLGIASHLVMTQFMMMGQANFGHREYPHIGGRIAFWVLVVLLGGVLVASNQVARVYHLKTLHQVGLKAERMETELKLLKSQISPHFLFNTLNNIYGLAYLKDERAADMISKLSKIMRYLLDDCDQPSVSLAKEKDLIEHYLSLQLLKHDQAKNVDFYHEGVLYSHRITPMILINFVENCFKHSDLETNPDGWIKISLEVEQNTLHFRTENTMREKPNPHAVRNGIGLTNSLRILQANYPDRHQVNIQQARQRYQLYLTLNL